MGFAALYPSYAGYVEMQWLMLQQEQPEGFVIATGEQHRVRDFVTIAAGELGIGLCWEGKGVDEIGLIESISAPKLRNPGGSSDGTAPGIHSTLKPGDIVVRVDPRYFRPTEVETLLGDPGKAQVGWVGVPEINGVGQWGQSNL